MSDKLLNILSNNNKDIDNQKLMDYLSDKLSAEERHEVEKQMVDSEMMSDAVEGLKNMEKKDLSILVDDLNKNLKKQLEKKNRRKQKLAIKDQPWIYLTIIIILLLTIIGFIVIKKHLDADKKIIPAQHSFVIEKFAKKLS
ncbi:MAG: hypothetical protein H0W12_10735 [Chitinophagaceae bacterium]|nr:hypothetical protein [Chitinophagaceae bacterium]